jgi:hypothetical protein
MKHWLKTIFCKVARSILHLKKLFIQNLVRCPKNIGENRESREANRWACANAERRRGVVGNCARNCNLLPFEVCH